MTTLIALQQPLELLSMSDQSVRRSKRHPATEYEQDDDFLFVRKSKKPKTEEQPEPVTVAAAPPVKKAGRGRPPAVRKAVAEDEAAWPATAAVVTKPTTTRKPTRRKATIDASPEEPPPKAAKTGSRRSARLSVDNWSSEETAPSQTNGSSRSNGRGPGRSKKAASKPSVPVVITEEEDDDVAIIDSPVHEESVESAKIALPMSDTPIINRNKEMRRKGGTSNRRSSLGSRGRRASSLIESGQTAIPHREVAPSEFFKHIEADLPEPRRMKQLLMWCGERALSAKPRGTLNSGAILGARAIQDLLLKDFGSRSDFSNWFSREDEVPEVPVILQPNPRNLELDEKMTALEARVKRLQEEKKAWLAIRKPPPELPPLFTPEESETITLPDFDLLDPDEGKIRGFLADETNSFSTIRSQTHSRLRRIRASLEFEVDQLADNVHKLEQRVLVAGREADRVLRLSAARLREREERERKSAGTRDMPIMEVLRSLSSILPEGGG